MGTGMGVRRRTLRQSVFEEENSTFMVSCLGQVEVFTPTPSLACTPSRTPQRSPILACVQGLLIRGGGSWQVSHGDPKKGLRNSRKKLALSGNKIGGLLRVGTRGGVGRSSPRTPHSFLLSLSLPPGNPWQVHTDTAGTCSMLCLITVEGPGR